MYGQWTITSLFVSHPKEQSISIQRAKGCFFSLQKARGFPAFSDGRTDSKFKLADKKILTIFHPQFFYSLFRNHMSEDNGACKLKFCRIFIQRPIKISI